jgi:CBS domain-containing protein
MTNDDRPSVGVLSGADVLFINAGSTLPEAAVIMAEAGVGALVVGSTDDVQGIVTERDVLKAVAAGHDLSSLTAGAVASTSLVYADENSPMDDVAVEMTENWVRHVLIERDGRLVGIVSARDLLGYYAIGIGSGG